MWTATVLPKTATGRPIGPGMGTLVSFQYADPKVRRDLRAPLTLDNVDGTYSTRLELGKKRRQVPQIGLYFGPPGRTDIAPVLIKDTSPKVHHPESSLDFRRRSVVRRVKPVTCLL